MAFDYNEEIRASIVASYPGIHNFDRATTAKIIGVSRGHIANCELNGTPLIPSVRVGRKPLYQLSDIVAFIKNQKIASEKRRRGPRTKAEKIEGGLK